jgi:hypothetical protein
VGGDDDRNDRFQVPAPMVGFVEGERGDFMPPLLGTRSILKPGITGRLMVNGRGRLGLSRSSRAGCGGQPGGLGIVVSGLDRRAKALQPNIPRTRLTSLLMSLRDRPAVIMAWRKLARAARPNSTAGEAP